MKTKTILIITIFSLICCSRKKDDNDGKVSLKLLNSEVNYIEIDSNLLLNSEVEKFKNIKSYTNIEREKASTILTYKIVNNSNKKYFFVLDTDIIDYFGNSTNFIFSHNNDSISIRKMCFLIDNAKIKNDITNDIITGGKFNYDDDSLNIYYKKYLDIQHKKATSNSIKGEDKLTLKNSFVIYPGEYKVFKQKIHLPIYIEKDSNPYLNFASIIIKPKNNYDFRLAISAKKDFIWNSLSKYKRNEILDNGYEIFDGCIISNKVPLKIETKIYK